MPVTNPENLAYPGRNGDTEETAVTNAAADGPGFPARLQGGELVFIVKQRREHQLKVLVDADGNEYVDDGVYGFLVPYSSEELPETADEIAEQDAVDQARLYGGLPAPAETAEEVSDAIEVEDTVEASEEDLAESA